jgi:hypothetical protein
MDFQETMYGFLYEDYDQYSRWSFSGIETACCGKRRNGFGSDHRIPRKGLSPNSTSKKLRPLPAFKCGRAKVDLSNRDELYRAMNL